jgi:hypothetical protein
MPVKKNEIKNVICERKDDEKGERKMDFKYSLIVSQYYHSRHMFVVLVKDDFIEKAKEFAYDLMTYKRDEGCDRELFAGDLDYIKDGEIRRRYNVNDSGDIYFIQSPYVNYCMHQAIEYHDDSIRESRGFQKKVITNAIDEHHNYQKVKEYVEKYFEIA